LIFKDKRNKEREGGGRRRELRELPFSGRGQEAEKENFKTSKFAARNQVKTIWMPRKLNFPRGTYMRALISRANNNDSLMLGVGVLGFWGAIRN